MDFSDLQTTPATAPEVGYAPPQQGQQPPPPPLPTPPQPKPYHEVLWEYKKAQGNGLPTDMGLPEFSTHMNNITGTQSYNEGMNDSPLRRAAGSIEVGLRHLGGAPAPPSPPDTPWWKAQSLGEALGGTNEGFNLPEATGSGVKSFMQNVLGVQNPQVLESAKAAGEALPGTGLTVGAGLAAGAIAPWLTIPAMGGAAAFQAYGETGRALPSAISGATAMVMPKAAEIGGQAFLKTVGAKTVGELAPETLAKLTSEEAAKIGGQYAPAVGWGPTALTQRAVRLAGAQTGMLTAGELGGASQVLTTPGETWQDKLGQLGKEFSPAGLVGTAISQLPFTAMDVFSERTHPLTQLDRQATASFTDKFTRAYEQDRVAAGVTGEAAQASPEIVQSAMQRAVDAKLAPKPDVPAADKPDGPAAPIVTTPEPKPQITPEAQQLLAGIGEHGVMPASRNEFIDKIATDNGITLTKDTTPDEIVQQLHQMQFEANKPENVAGRVLKSIGMAPVSFDWGNLKINTAEGQWKGEEARQAVLARANSVLNAMNTGLRATEAQDLSVYKVLSAVKDLHLPQSSILHIAGNMVADGMTQSETNLGRMGTMGITAEERDAQIRNEPITYGAGHDVKAETNTDKEIVDRITKVNKAEDGTTSPNPNYDPELHQRIALLSGDQEHWTEAGIPEQPLIRISGPAENVIREFPGSTVTVRRATTQNVPLTTNIIDRLTGLSPKPADKAASIQTEIAALESRVYEHIANGGDPQDRSLDAINGKLEDLRELADAVGEEVRGGRARSITADTTFAARKMAMDFKKSDGTPFDVTNPNDVGEYYSAIAHAVSVAERGYLRSRESEPWITDKNGAAIPGQPALRVESAKEAVSLANELNSLLGDIKHINFTVPKDADGNPKPEPDGTFRIVRNTFRQLYPLTAEEEHAVTAEEGVLPMTAGKVPEAPEIETPGIPFAMITRLGIDVKNVEREEFLRRFSEINKIFKDRPAEREGHNAALAQNIIDGISAMKGKDLANFIEGEAAMKPNSLRNRDIWKQRFIAFVEFLRDHGQVSMEFEHPAEGVVRVFGRGDLDGLNNYMRSKDPSYGLAEGKRLNDRGTSDVSLNFFDRFYILSKLLQKTYYDPRKFNELMTETRPMGAWRWLPPNFWEDPEKHITIQGAGAVGAEKVNYPKLGEFVEGAEGKEGVLTLQDRNGNNVKFLVPHNPLITFHIKAMNKQLTTDAHNYMQMFRNYARFQDEKGQWQSLVPQNMLDLAGGLMDKLPYLRNLRVGSGIAIDPTVHGYFHTDDLGSSAGILMSPYRPDYTNRNAAMLMNPAEIFSHFLHELGHGATQFAYARDADFKRQVDEVHSYLKKYHDDNMQRASKDVFGQSQMHALSSPEEMLAAVFHDGQTDPRYAGQFHSWLKNIPDMLPPLPNTVPGSIFDRIFNMIRGLFEKFTNREQSATMLDRLASLAATGADITSGIGVQGRGNIYDQMKAIELKSGQDLIHRPFAEPVPVPKKTSDLGYWWGGQREFAGEISLREVLKDRESALADAQKNYRNIRRMVTGGTEVVTPGLFGAEDITATREGAKFPEYYDLLVKAAEELNQRQDELHDIQRRVGAGHLLTDTEAARDLGWHKDTENGVRGFRDNKTGKFFPYAEVQEQLNNAKLAEFQRRGTDRGGRVLESRTVQDRDEEPVGVPKPVINLQGKKTTLLRDPVMNNIVRTAANGRVVVDSFAGTGTVAQFSKLAGAKRVVMNVRDPDSFKMWSEMKANPDSFARRVEAAVRPINSVRNEIPRMRDGSSLTAHLDNVERQDPNVGRFVKQNLNFMGREYPVEGKFTPASTLTNKGLSELGDRVRAFAQHVDEVKQSDGWESTRNVQPGQLGTVDPTYVGERGRYGEGKITPEQRIKEYEDNMYPAARNGANFLVFDLAHPQLIKSLTDNGFNVQPYQRTDKGGRNVRQELVAFNHEDAGRMLESRANVGAVQDAMNAGSDGVVEDRDKIWFHPYDLKHFRNMFAPAFGDRLELAQRGGQWGYEVNKANGFGSLMQSDVDAMPRTPPNPYAPTVYETLFHLYRADGSDEPTSRALATFQQQFAALLRNSEDAIWGVIPKETGTAGRAWSYGAKLIGLTPFDKFPIAGAGDLRSTIQHEATHAAGMTSSPVGRSIGTTPDVQRAYEMVNRVFITMSEPQRLALLEGLARLTDHDNRTPWVYQRALASPAEFAAEFMGHVGDVIGNVPEPSVYLRDTMRFAPDDLSNLLKYQMMRRSQGLDGLKYYTKQQMAQRGVGKTPSSLIIDTLSDIFRSLLRPTLEIARDQSEFQTMRLLFPDTYRPLMLNFAAQIQQRGAEARTRAEAAGQRPATSPFPQVPGRVLQSKEPPWKDEVRKFFRLPTTEGTLPDKLTLWDRFLTQFPQLAEKYPAARPFYDVMSVARAMSQAASRENQTALAGVYTGKGQLQDDTRTNHIATFYKSPRLQEAFSKIGLELNSLGDNNYNTEYTASGKNIMAMDPAKVTGFLTPQFRDAQMRKLGITDAKDRQALETVLQGVQNQYFHANGLIIRSKEHDLTTMVAKAISVNSDFRPEQARTMAQLLTDGLKVQAVDPQQAQDKFMQFAAQVNNPDLQAKLFDLGNSQYAAIQKLARFLDLRVPYFMSERRPGKYGVIWKDDSGNIRSFYEKDGATRDKYIARNNITPIRVTNPQDPNWGISQSMWEVMDSTQKRMVEKLTNVLGADEAKRLAPLMDMSTDLKDSLNARDILKLTTRRELAPGREELNMFDTSQHYMRSVINAVRNRFIKNEAELLFTNPEFDTQPYLKDYVQDHIQKTVLTPDSQAGRYLQQLSFMYYLFMNPSSMIMQMSHQVMGLAPKLTELGASVAGSFNTIKNANLAVIEAMRNGGRYKDGQLDSMVKRMKDEGVIVSTFSRELDHAQDLSIANRMRVTDGRSAITPFDLLKNKAYQGYLNMRRLYDIIPTYNSEVAAVAALMHLRSKAGGSYSGDELFNQARFVKDNTMYPGGKENRPGYFQVLPRSAAQALWSLQTYSNGLTTMMGNLIRKAVNPVGAGLTPAQATQTRKAAAQMLITQIGVAGTLGLPFAQAMLFALQKLLPQHNVEESIRETLASLGGDDEALGRLISTSLTTGIPSATDWAPDVGSRFALHGVFHVSPYSGVDWEQLMGASGGVLARLLEAGKSGLEGDPMGAVQGMMPNGFQRIWKALEDGHNYTTSSGRLLVSDLSPVEIAARSIGFTPGRVAKLQTAERMYRLSEEADKASQTRFVKEQVDLLKSGRDAEVRQNIANRIAETKGTTTEAQAGSDIAHEFERQTMPFDIRRMGNRATVLAQKRLRTLAPSPYGLPSNVDRLQLQQMIAQRLGLQGPKTGSWRHASGVDQLLETYPHLTVPQANLLLTHAAGSRPSYDLYQELLSNGE